MMNPNDPAFPHVADFGIDDRSMAEGLTKREWFAGMAMQGMLANPNEKRQYPDLQDYAVKARVMADALIKELSEEKK